LLGSEPFVDLIHTSLLFFQKDAISQSTFEKFLRAPSGGLTSLDEYSMIILYNTNQIIKAGDRRWRETITGKGRGKYQIRVRVAFIRPWRI
jgi:hypothetical protein